MDQLIARIVAATGLNPQLAQEAVGLILGFLQKNAHGGAFEEVIKAIPGASELLAQGGGESAQGGGLMGALGGMLGGLGGSLGGGVGGAAGLMGLASALSGKGLDMSQMKGVGEAIYSHASEFIGPEKTEEIFKSVPGLSAMFSK